MRLDVARGGVHPGRNSVLGGMALAGPRRPSARRGCLRRPLGASAPSQALSAALRAFWGHWRVPRGLATKCPGRRKQGGPPRLRSAVPGFAASPRNRLRGGGASRGVGAWGRRLCAERQSAVHSFSPFGLANCPAARRASRGAGGWCASPCGLRCTVSHREAGSGIHGGCRPERREGAVQGFSETRFREPDFVLGHSCPTRKSEGPKGAQIRWCPTRAK